jgi:hypothetical protein
MGGVVEYRSTTPLRPDFGLATRSVPGCFSYSSWSGCGNDPSRVHCPAHALEPSREGPRRLAAAVTLWSGAQGYGSGPTSLLATTLAYLVTGRPQSWILLP